MLGSELSALLHVALLVVGTDTKFLKLALFRLSEWLPSLTCPPLPITGVFMPFPSLSTPQGLVRTQDSQGPTSEELECQGHAVMPSLRGRHSLLLSLGFSQQKRKLSLRGSLKMSDI